MKNNEKFIKNWEKNRQKGKTKYIASNILIFVATYWILTIIVDLIGGYGFSNLFDSFDTFIAGFVGASVGMYLSWYRNESKYNKIMKNK